MNQDSGWKILVVIAFLVFMACAGIAHIIKPDRFIPVSRRGGEMLNTWNSFGIRVFGVVFTAAIFWMLYSILRDYFEK